MKQNKFLSNYSKITLTALSALVITVISYYYSMQEMQQKPHSHNTAKIIEDKLPISNNLAIYNTKETTQPISQPQKSNQITTDTKNIEGERQADLYEAQPEHNSEQTQPSQQYEEIADNIDLKRFAEEEDMHLYETISTTFQDLNLPLAYGGNDGCSKKTCSFEFNHAGPVIDLYESSEEALQENGFADITIMRLPDGRVRMFAVR